MRRSTGQGDLGEAWLPSDLGQNERLDRIGRLFDWSAVEGLVSGLHTARTGRPGWPPVVLLKALLLQQWYGLSDPGLEEALSDRLSFRRFVGLGLEAGQPDHSVISRFRKTLREQGLDAALFTEVERQLQAQGLILKSGTLMDATVVSAAVWKMKHGGVSRVTCSSFESSFTSSDDGSLPSRARREPAWDFSPIVMTA